MFRVETRYFLLFLVLISTTGVILLLINLSIKNKQLEETRNNLKLQLQLLRSKLNLEPQARLVKKEGLRDITSTINYEDNHKLNSSSWPTKNVNIFLEVYDDARKGGELARLYQFYKQPGLMGSQKLFSKVLELPDDKRRRILVTGGAGFVGSHLVDSLMLDGHSVIVCDNFVTGRRSNIDHWIGHPNFELIHHDVINPLTIEVNEIYHLASPASPIHYMMNPIKTIKTNTIGTINMLGLAKRVGAKILIASTSEIYGDPLEHPQSESYWGHTNPVGPRSCYDEGKRVSESLAVAYSSRENVPVRIARIFNTYGPRMHPNDGRVVSNFIMQSLRNEPLTIHGDGEQTRSFQYVTDLVSGLRALMVSNCSSPVNLGNPVEMTVKSLASSLKRLLPNSTSAITFGQSSTDDPRRRQPDIRKAQNVLSWFPVVNMTEGLTRTIEYFSQELGFRS